MNLVMMGPPGAGKGTQSKILSAKHAVPQVSTGDILRDAVKRRSRLGVEAKMYMDRGQLVRDGIVVGIIEERLRRPDCAQGFILDGFPRNTAQAEALDSMLKGIGRPLDFVLLIEVNEEALIKRLTGRRVCKACGSEYHLLYKPSAKGAECETCGGEIIQRSDDREEVIRERLKVYRESTAPLAEYYGATGILRRVEGDGPIDSIQAKLNEILTDRAPKARSAAS